MSNTNTPTPGSTRRGFLKTAAGTCAFTFLPSRILWGAEAPSEQFRFAQVGCGGKGRGDLKWMSSSRAKLVTMCDLDGERASEMYGKYPDLPKYTDYRVMLDKHEKEIDGVVVSTPDHTHACIALEAIRRGKHVYVQKPLARTYQECRILQEAARKHGAVTQMGNQGHSGGGLKVWEKMQHANAFGDIEGVHVWSNRPIWPQGMTKAPTPGKIPESLDWGLWQGPVAERPYSEEYLPFKWRGWWDYGCGAMGDMACHNMDPAFWIFKLGMPNKIKARASAPAGIAYPEWSIIEYTFDSSPVTGKPVKLVWYDGSKQPKAPENAHPNLKMGGNGCMVVGSAMTALGGSHAGLPRPIALSDRDFGPEVKEAEKFWRDEGKKIKGHNHYGEWIQAAKDGKPGAPGSGFDYSAPFTQAILLGCIALRFPDRELTWDAAKARFSNNDEANQWLSFKPRPGFGLEIS